MSGNTSPGPSDSLDFVELAMAIEEAFDIQLTALEKEGLMREIQERIARGGFGDDFDDDDFAVLVRKLGPRSPRGQAVAVSEPEEPSFE